MEKRKRTKEQTLHLQNITQKTKHRATRTPLKPGDELNAPVGLTFAALHVTTIV